MKVFKGVFDILFFKLCDFFVGVSPWNSRGKRSLYASSDHISIPPWMAISCECPENHKCQVNDCLQD